MYNKNIKNLKTGIQSIFRGIIMGYKGYSRKFLDSSGITIGDIVKITKNETSYQGNST